MNRCIIISAAPYSDISFYKSKIADGDFIICADGGYDYARNAGIEPDRIVGDFDSASIPDTDTETIILPVHKDDTDTMYAAREALKRGFRDIVMLAATGGREDHTQANYAVMLYLKRHGCSVKIAAKDFTVFILENELVTIENQKDKTFSIFPFACKRCGISLKGFEYPLASYTLKAEYPLGVSNVITSDKAEVGISGGSAIVYIYELS